MRLKALVVAGAVLLAGLAVSGNAFAAVTCPAGSLRGDANPPIAADSYAECNLPVKQAGEKTLMETVQQIITVIIGVLGIVAVAVVILGGVYYVISQGEAAKITRAKNTILYGIVGLVIAILAYAIVNFVMAGVFSNNSGAAPTDTTDQSTGNN